MNLHSLTLLRVSWRSEEVEPMVTDIISEKHISEEIQEDKCWDWELILAIQHLFLNSKRKAVTFLFPVTNRFQREITERLLLPAPSNRHCFSIPHSPFQQRWPKAKRLHRETKRVFFLLGKEREKERERYLWMRVYPTETAHSCWLTDPHWGQDILGRAHTPWVIHQFYLLQLVSLDPLLTSQNLGVKKALPLNPSHSEIPPYPTQPAQGWYSTVQPFSSNTHHLADFIQNYMCSVPQQGHASYRCFLAIGETSVMIQSVLASGFYSQDRQHFA